MTTGQKMGIIIAGLVVLAIIGFLIYISIPKEEEITETTTTSKPGLGGFIAGIFGGVNLGSLFSGGGSDTGPGINYPAYG